VLDIVQNTLTAARTTLHQFRSDKDRELCRLEREAGFDLLLPFCPPDFVPALLLEVQVIKPD
jgi:hypothetical protein